MLRHALSFVVAAGITAWTTLTAGPTAVAAGFSRLALFALFLVPVASVAEKFLKGPPPI